jgi:hypothetical protein
MSGLENWGLVCLLATRHPIHFPDHASTVQRIADGIVCPSQPGDPAPPTTAPSASTSTVSKTDGAGMGVGLYALVLLGGLAAFGAYKYLQMKSEGSK